MGRNIDHQGLANNGGAGVKGEQLGAVLEWPLENRPEANVHPINQYDFYELGHQLHALSLVPNESTLGRAYVPLANAQTWLKKLLLGDWIELSFSRHEAQTLLGYVEECFTTYYNDKDGNLDLGKNWDDKISAWELSRVKSALERFEHNLAAELRAASAYWIARKSIYDTARLVETSENRIHGSLRPLMNPMATKDFHDAGRALAFDLPTAAGLHLARAVEGVLADYYRAFAGAKAEVPGTGTMGDYLRELEDKDQMWITTKPPEQKTLRCLREIKDLDRNRLMHPRESLDEIEAEIFFNLATSAIMQMTREMQELIGGAGLSVAVNNDSIAG